MPKIAGIFPIGDTGEEFGVAIWEPDPELIAQELFKLANETENWAEPLAETRAAFIYSTELHFDTQSDPYGQPWWPLDPVYLAKKVGQGYPETILERSGDLKRAATSEDAWLIEEHALIFDSSQLPFYGEYHQRGTDEGQRAAVERYFAGEDVSASELESRGRGRNLPQRMFIGADEDTILEIEEIFIRWLDRLIFTTVPVFGGGFAIRERGTGRFVGVYGR